MEKAFSKTSGCAFLKILGVLGRVEGKAVVFRNKKESRLRRAALATSFPAAAVQPCLKAFYYIGTFSYEIKNAPTMVLTIIETN